MVLPLDDILKAISSGRGPGAQIARGALRPTQIGGTNRFLSPTVGAGPFAHLVGTLAAALAAAGAGPPFVSGSPPALRAHAGSSPA